jgi:chemotaxis protein methyltransferase WspC
LVAKKPAFTKPIAAPLEKTEAPTSAPAASSEEKPSLISEQLREIEILANQGDLDEAETACTAYLNRFPNSPQGHYLRGCILQAQDKPRLAKESLKKAIYLAPDHQDAMVHLASLAEIQGDKEEARKYRDRAMRIREKLGTE